MPHGITCEKIMDVLTERFKIGFFTLMGGAGVLLENLRCPGLQGPLIANVAMVVMAATEVGSLHSTKD